MSVWDTLFESMKSSGTTETTSGQLGQGFAQYQGLQTQALGYEISGSQAGANIDILESQISMLGVKREEIELDAVNERVYSSQKWLARRGAVKAGFAARGVKVDASAQNDTPSLIMAQMLANIDEEARQIDLNRKLRIFNEVSIPTYQIRSAQGNARYQKEIAQINERASRRAANLALLSSVANTVYGVYTGYSAPQKTYQGGKSKNVGTQ